MRAALAVLLGLVLWGGARADTAAQQTPFRDWAAIVVAGDWRAAGGRDTKAFENARRDVTGALVEAGFQRANLRTFGVSPTAPGVAETEGPAFVAGLRETSGRARGGCLLYFTSHGSPQGIIFGRKGMLAPTALDRLLDSTCADRPTVVFVSACFSGVFVPALAAPNRLIVTAARPDRSSFGCGEGDRYPFFDACVLEAWPVARDFLNLGRAVQGCVSRREREMKLAPPSEPQISAGPRIRPLLPLLPLPGALARAG
ncbi:MAG TPA: C13 family peptidase [Caulobacteraceae bacterium]